jgi:hypothetical protein
MSKVTAAARVIGISLIMLLVMAERARASYVIYDQAINSNAIGSVPEQESGFYYSDSHGNSISVSKTRNIPAVINQYPTAVWVGGVENRLPVNAIILEYINGNPVYHCRVVEGKQILYGKLYPDQGCVITDGSMQTFVTFEVLVR